MVLRREFFAVHKCTEEHEFEKAQKGYQVLYYSSHPIPKGIVSRSTFPGEYYVPPEKAMTLLDLIRKDVSPNDIVRQLNLERIPLEDLELRFERQEQPRESPINNSHIVIVREYVVQNREHVAPKRPEMATQYQHPSGMKERRFYEEKD